MVPMIDVTLNVTVVPLLLMVPGPATGLNCVKKLVPLPVIVPEPAVTVPVPVCWSLPWILAFVLATRVYGPPVAAITTAFVESFVFPLWTITSVVVAHCILKP